MTDAERRRYNALALLAAKLEAERDRYYQAWQEEVQLVGVLARRLLEQRERGQK